MKLVTIEPFDGHGPNETIDVSEPRARKLIEKGLAKAAPVPQGKMAAEGENKADPSEAAGEGRTSSASRAAPRSPRKTATRSTAGAKPRGGRKPAG